MTKGKNGNKSRNDQTKERPNIEQIPNTIAPSPASGPGLTLKGGDNLSETDFIISSRRPHLSLNGPSVLLQQFNSLSWLL